MRQFLGIDVGTQGTKAALFAEDGTALAESSQSSRPRRPGAGIVEEDPQAQVESVVSTIRGCLRARRADPRRVSGLAIAGQMAGVIGIGADGLAVTPYDSWLDTRCAPYIGLMDRKAGAEVVEKTGGPASFNHGPKILWWMHERPRMYRSIRAFVQPGGYAAMRLCGLEAKGGFVDWTYLHFSGFADNRRRAWDEALCRKFDLDPCKLPRIAAPTEVVGELTGSWARRCGLRPGVPVVAGCGDTAASFLACGATREGVCVDVAGSASVFASVTRRFRPDRKLRMLSCGQAASEGLWHPYAYINGGGLNLEWFRGWISKSFGSDSPVTCAGLDREAEPLVPAMDDPMFVPHLEGRVAPAWPRLRGAWINLNRGHGRGHLWRAMLESVALEYGLYRARLQEIDGGSVAGELRVTGGGERSLVWNQIKADVLGMNVVQIARSRGASMGAALLAAAGVGAVRDLDAGARRWVSTGRITRPNRRLDGHYACRLRQYERTLRSLNAIAQESEG